MPEQEWTREQIAELMRRAVFELDIAAQLTRLDENSRRDRRRRPHRGGAHCGRCIPRQGGVPAVSADQIAEQVTTHVLANWAFIYGPDAGGIH